MLVFHARRSMPGVPAQRLPFPVFFSPTFLARVYLNKPEIARQAFGLSLLAKKLLSQQEQTSIKGVSSFFGLLFSIQLPLYRPFHW